MIENQMVCSEMVEKCFMLFVENGLRAVSMEDIAQACCVSKKELYDKFGNKEGVIRQALQYDFKVSKELFQKSHDLCANAIEETIYVHKHFMNMLSNLSPVLFFDLNKHYVEVGLEHMNKKLELNKQFVLRNLTRGLEEGIYRPEIDKEIVGRLWVSKMELIKEQKWFPLYEFDIQRLIHQFAELHLRSIVNDKGLEIIYKYNLNNNK